MKAVSIRGNSTEAIKAELDESMADGFKPTLAIVFISVKQDRRAVCKLLNDAGIAIFGATTNGEFIDEDLSFGEMAILLLEINPAYFMVFFEEFNAKNYRQVAREIAGKAYAKFRSPSFLVVACNQETDAEELLMGFEDIGGEEVSLFGGMAGDDYAFKDQFVFDGTNDTGNGIIVIAFDEEKIEVKGRSTGGWQAVGTPKTVTKSDGNHVYTVDNIPVLELTRKYGGMVDLDGETIDIVIKIATSLPLQLQREHGDPIMRPASKVNFEDGSFYCSGKVPEGAKVRFSLPPDFDVIEKVIDSLEDLKETQMPEAEALVVFNCGGRNLSFGPMMKYEIEGIGKVWDVPMAGFFSNAELGRATNGNLEVHNLTTCCVALKEK